MLSEIAGNFLRYDPTTGKLFWKERTDYTSFKDGVGGRKANCNRWNGHYAGKEAFTSKKSGGHLHGAIHGKSYMAHRVAWAIFYQEEPPQYIDHINGDPSDNRIENLRAVTAAENSQNQKLRSDNASGTHGVSWDSKNKKWMAAMRINGKSFWLGRFEIKEQAEAEANLARSRLGFHENHGKDSKQRRPRG